MSEYKQQVFIVRFYFFSSNYHSKNVGLKKIEKWRMPGGLCCGGVGVKWGELCGCVEGGNKENEYGKLPLTKYDQSLFKTQALPLTSLHSTQNGATPFDVCCLFQHVEIINIPGTLCPPRILLPGFCELVLISCFLFSDIFSLYSTPPAVPHVVIGVNNLFCIYFFVIITNARSLLHCGISFISP